MSIATIENELLSLSPQDRAKVIDFLWDSLSGPETKDREAAWAMESERRIDAYDQGLLKARDADEVLSDLRKDLRK